MIAVALACAVAALAVCPPKLQIVVVLAIVAYLSHSLRPVEKQKAGNAPRYKYPAESVVDRPCSGQADKFADATAVVSVVSAACDKFDATKGAEMAAELDTCIDEYMRVLNGQKSSYSSHVLSRDKV